MRFEAKIDGIDFLVLTGKPARRENHANVYISVSESRGAFATNANGDTLLGAWEQLDWAAAGVLETHGQRLWNLIRALEATVSAENDKVREALEGCASDAIENYEDSAGALGLRIQSLLEYNTPLSAIENELRTLIETAEEMRQIINGDKS